MDYSCELKKKCFNFESCHLQVLVLLKAFSCLPCIQFAQSFENLHHWYLPSTNFFAKDC